MFDIEKYQQMCKEIENTVRNFVPEKANQSVMLQAGIKITTGGHTIKLESTYDGKQLVGETGDIFYGTTTFILADLKCQNSQLLCYDTATHTLAPLDQSEYVREPHLLREILTDHVFQNIIICCRLLQFPKVKSVDTSTWLRKKYWFDQSKQQLFVDHDYEFFVSARRESEVLATCLYANQLLFDLLINNKHPDVCFQSRVLIYKRLRKLSFLKDIINIVFLFLF